MIQIRSAQIRRPDTGKKYWRSLDQLYQTSEFQQWLHREFPANAPEMLEEPSRRYMLKIMAASFGLAGLTACRKPVEHVMPNVKGAEDFVHGKPLYYNTSMSLGGAATGLTVEVNDGRPTKVEGNPEHPFSLGAANGYHQGSILGLYDPDRLPEPRVDGRQTNWEEFATFASDEFQAAKVGAGEGLRFLSDRVTSPSLAAVRTAALARYPQAKWVEFDAISNEAERLGAELAFGQPVAVRHHFDKAEVILSLDADFLGLDALTLLPVKEFSRGRRVTSEADSMNRLYVVESQYSVTGAMADHRLRMRSSEVQSFAADLARQLGAGGNELQVLGAGSGDRRKKWLTALAKDLQAHRGKCLVVAGPRQPAAVHAVAHVLNESLGNAGSTVTYLKPPSSAARPQIEALRELAGEMAGGRVRQLVIVGWNPAYTAPADLEFAANIKKVPVSVYLAQEFDETAAAVKWAVPAAHFLESWSDATAPDGTVTIQQPMVQPLHGGRTEAEVVALLTGYQDQRAYDIVKNVWLEKLPGAEKEKAWRKALHDGTVAGTQWPEAKPLLDARRANSAIQGSTAATGIEVVFVQSSSTYDGRFANNGWMQEAPDPMTKLTWDNAALVSPATAKKLGVERGDIITVERQGRKVDAPVLVQPGQADDSIAIALGYGRSRSGRVGTNVGVNAYLLRASDGMHFASGFNVTKAAGTWNLAQTQDHHTMEEPLTEVVRPIVREATLEHYRKEPNFTEELVEHPPLQSIYGDYDYSRGQQWGMAIDLNSCIGCNACMIACQAENNIPVVGKEQVLRGREMHWIRMDRYFVGSHEDPQVVNQPIPCQQCETAPCENVCPVAATTHSPEGLNDMAYNRCVGTRYCSNNCPYKVRRFNFLNFHGDVPETTKMAFNPDVTVRMRGIMEKCTYCVQRIQEKRIQSKVENRRQIQDGELQTACQQTCPADAIVFGNVNDANSRVSKLKSQNRNYALLAELNTKPRTTYLSKLRNPNPELEAHHG